MAKRKIMGSSKMKSSMGMGNPKGKTGAQLTAAQMEGKMGRNPSMKRKGKRGM